MDFILSYLANFLQGRIKIGAFYCFLFEDIYDGTNCPFSIFPI